MDKYNNTLLVEPRNRDIFPEPPMLAYRRPPNLRDLITRARVRQPLTSKPPGFSNCADPNCALHEFNNPGSTFTSTVTKVTYPITQPLNCDDHNIIYLITCKQCNQQYVGETGRKHKDRSIEHIKGIQDRIAKETPVKLHFKRENHHLEDFSIQVIERCSIEDTDYRRAREREWQDLIKPEINKSHWKKYKNKKGKSFTQKSCDW